MSDLVLELFCEEIPSRFQSSSLERLKSAFALLFKDQEIFAEEVSGEITPHRMVIFASGLPENTPERYIARRGPKISAPAKAIDGFLRSCGLSSIEQCEIKKDAKGDFLLAKINIPGKNTKILLEQEIPKLLSGFAWEKSMRWGENGSKIRWVRPIRNILCLFGDNAEAKIANESMSPLKFEFGTLVSNNQTQIWQDGSFERVDVANISSYLNLLGENGIILSKSDRINYIKKEASQIAFTMSLNCILDDKLVDEISGLAERPRVLMTSFDKKYLKLPSEIAISIMRNHQKYLPLTDDQGRLSENYIVVANSTNQSAEQNIISGNRRVMQARLGDAKFYWDNDVNRGLTGEKIDQKLADIRWHSKLGSQLQRRNRVAELARLIVSKVSLSTAGDEEANVAKNQVEQAKSQIGLLADASLTDLISGIVSEFPELQGVAGARIAAELGWAPEICDALEQQYWPKAADSAVPSSLLARCIAVAQRLDALAGFWLIGELPTGSSDPFALRRAAIAIVRICYADFEQDNQPVLPNLFGEILDAAFVNYISILGDSVISATWSQSADNKNLVPLQACKTSLIDFVFDKLFGQILKDKIASADVVASLLSISENAAEISNNNASVLSICEIAQRCSVLEDFKRTPDAKVLIETFRRANNILRQYSQSENDKNEALFDASADNFGKLNSKLFVCDDEKKLYECLLAVFDKMQSITSYREKLTLSSTLSKPLAEFFENVTVMDDNAAIRNNRLLLLDKVKKLILALADLGKLIQ